MIVPFGLLCVVICHWTNYLRRFLSLVVKFHVCKYVCHYIYFLCKIQAFSNCLRWNLYATSWCVLNRIQLLCSLPTSIVFKSIPSVCFYVHLYTGSFDLMYLVGRNVRILMNYSRRYSRRESSIFITGCCVVYACLLGCWCML